MSTNQPAIKATRRSLRNGRKLRTFSTSRVCAYDGCGTRLSRYNRADRCHVHDHRRYPRAG